MLFINDHGPNKGDGQTRSRLAQTAPFNGPSPTGCASSADAAGYDVERTRVIRPASADAARGSLIGA